MYDRTRMLRMVRPTSVALVKPAAPGITIDSYHGGDWNDLIHLDLEAANASGAVEIGTNARASMDEWIRMRWEGFESSPAGPVSTGFLVRIARAEDGRVLGEVMLSGCDSTDPARVVEIVSIAVKATHRRMGIGAMLVRDALGIALTNDYRSLVIDVEKDNRVARNFYATLGFTDH
jgi:ribosomal protein S18 acetylase RimI-like enzyme